MAARAATDAVTREVISHSLISAAEEMSKALGRSAYSAIIYDMLDYSCAIFGPEGELVSQAENLPAQLGVMSSAIGFMLRKFPSSSMKPGDVFIMNDPYTGATHTLDLVVAAPIYYEGRLMGFAGTNAHHLDMGGKVVCTEAADNTEIFQEGLILPIVRLYEQGVPSSSVFDIIQANVRIPKQTIGDLRAQVAACRTGERRITEICDRYGANLAAAYVSEVLDYTERRVRQEIQGMRDGTYYAEGHMDPDYFGTRPIRICTEVTVADGGVHVDFSGTDAQVAGSLNNPYASTVSAIWFAVRCMIDPSIPQNEGCYRPISYFVPEGSILNPRRPAAVSIRHLTQQKAADVLLSALKDAQPSRSAAGCSVSFPTWTAGGIDPRTEEPYLASDIIGGGMGASAGGDGLSAVDTHMGNCAMMSAEAMEVEFPFRVLRTELVPDSGGAGRHRGGLAIERSYQFLGQKGVVGVHYADQTRDETRPWGLVGGMRGKPAGVTLTDAKGDERQLPSKGVNYPLRQGEILTFRSSGGGGYGPPSERSLDDLNRDLRDGYVTYEEAIKEYGFFPSKGPPE